MVYNLWLTIKLADVADVLIVSFLVYHIFCLLSGTRAANLLKGLGLIFLVRIVAERLHLCSLDFILQAGMTVGLVAIIVIFQPELRAALERIGRGGILQQSLNPEELSSMARVIDETTARMSRVKMGALVVFERSTGLREFIETGVELNAALSCELLVSLFWNGTPLHDGAAVVKGNRLAAASCFLPLSQNPDLKKEMGSRHRAAIGITEVTDAVAVVVSEETGTISWAEGGVLTPDVGGEELRRRLVRATADASGRDSRSSDAVRTSGLHPAV